MRKVSCLLVLAFIALHVFQATAQEKTKPADGAKTVLPLKVTVVFTEYDGEKKLSSLPYALFLRTEENFPARRFIGTLRMGVRVPIWTGSKDAAITYQDIGSNLDCSVQPTEDGKYVLDMTVERSSLYPNAATTDEHSAEQRPGEHPLVRTFRASLALMLRDGQTTQSTVATDPLNGHITKVDVTLNVLK